MSRLDEIFSTELNRLKSEQLNWEPKTLKTPSSNRAMYDGKKVILLCANNYLGLSNHPSLKKAAIDATKKYGAGSGAVRAISGTMELHVKLEKKIAQFKKTPAALFYQSGFTVNSGFIPAMTGEGWLLISDELNHGSIIDGVRLSKGDKTIYKHSDMDDLKRVLAENREKYKNILVITDGVFSMDGDIAKLDEIVEAANEAGAFVYVDDAHGDGVLGKNGAGIVSHFHQHGKVDIEMGTFSKAFGVVGGYVCGSKELCEFALNKSRTWLLTGSHPPAVSAACIAALETIQKNPSLVKTLWKNREFFIGGLKDLGFDTGKSQTPIIPIMLGESSTAKKFSQELFKKGVYGLPIVFPMVAQGKARIRTQVSASHTKKDLEEALDAIEKVGKEIKII
ncbi:MAG: glycine C-acetyltransferase [Candidatus Diapherotrites archaeon]|nr:glycine C-acetyltransferase [Candidatus Diapherotrites archaeon]